MGDERCMYLPNMSFDDFCMVNVGKYTVRSMDSLWVWSLYIWQMAAFCSCPMEAGMEYIE